MTKAEQIRQAKRDVNAVRDLQYKKYTGADTLTIAEPAETTSEVEPETPDNPEMLDEQ